MVYVLLLGAIACEVLGTSLLRSTDGFTRLAPSAVCIAAYICSFALLAQVVRSMPTGTAYAMWAALGTTAVVVVGVVFLGESVTAVKAIGVMLVVGGVVLLNLGGAH